MHASTGYAPIGHLRRVCLGIVWGKGWQLCRNPRPDHIGAAPAFDGASLAIDWGYSKISITVLYFCWLAKDLRCGAFGAGLGGAAGGT